MIKSFVIQCQIENDSITKGGDVSKKALINHAPFTRLLTYLFAHNFQVQKSTIWV